MLKWFRRQRELRDRAFVDKVRAIIALDQQERSDAAWAHFQQRLDVKRARQSELLARGAVAPVQPSQDRATEQQG